MTDIDLFVSHSTHDDALVSQIHDQLEASGLNIWVDHEDGINASDNWAKEIDQAVNSCQAGLFVMSNESVVSDYSRAEWQRILARGLILYTVMIDTIPLEKIPIVLSTIQYIDLRSDFDKGIGDLIKSIKGKTRLESSTSSAKKVLSITGTFPRHHLDIPLIGRDREIAQIQGDLEADNRLIAILGFGGLGKTRLASEVAVTTTFRDGVVWHTISTYTSMTDLTASIRDHLKLDESHNDDAVWTSLTHKQILIVLDNAEDCRDRPAYAQCINQLDLSGGSRVLMTSRYQWREVRSKTLNLPFLNKTSAMTVFQKMLDLEKPDYSADAYIEDLVVAGRFHPRLMQYSVSWLNSYPADYVLEILQSLEGTDAQEILNDIVQKTIERVQEQDGGATAISALRRLAVCQGGFTFEATRAIIDEVRSVALLKQWNLIDLNERRYAIDPMVTKVVGIDETAYPAHFDYYKQLAQTHNEAQDYAGLDIESANLDVAFAWQLQHDVAKAFWFCNTCSAFLLNRGRIRKHMKWLKQIESLLPDDIDAEFQSAFNNNLGLAYWNLATVENREVNIRTAITAYQQALKYLTSDNTYLDYAKTQNNLGNAYSELAFIESKEVNLRIAIAAYQNALEYYTPQNAPLAYASTQNNLGSAYVQLSTIEHRQEYLRRAISAYQTALEYSTPDSAPLSYASTQNNLGSAYVQLSTIEHRQEYLRRAISAYQTTLEYSTPDSAPLSYAMTQYNLGNVYLKLSTIEHRQEYLNRAIIAYQNALEYYTPYSAPSYYASTQNNLGSTYRMLAGVDNSWRNLTLAIEAYCNAIKIEATAIRYYWRGETYRLLERYEEALADIDKALELDPDDNWAKRKRKEILALLNRDD